MSPRCAVSLLARGDGWVALSKPAGLLVHPTRPDGSVTLLGLVQAYLAPEIAAGARVSFVHRLDRETSGVILAATNATAARHFGGLLQRGAMGKEYRALVLGHPAWEEQRIDAPLLRAGSRGESTVWLRQRIHPEGSRAATSFRVLARFARAGQPFALLKATPHSGRMHQIRVHAAALGHPLVGDKLYAGDGSHYLRFIETGWTPELASDLHLPRHALHAHSLEFPDVSGRGQRITARAPPDLAEFAGSWP